MEQVFALWCLTLFYEPRIFSRLCYWKVEYSVGENFLIHFVWDSFSCEIRIYGSNMKNKLRKYIFLQQNILKLSVCETSVLLLWMILMLPRRKKSEVHTTSIILEILTPGNRNTPITSFIKVLNVSESAELVVNPFRHFNKGLKRNISLQNFNQLFELTTKVGIFRYQDNLTVYKPRVFKYLTKNQL